MNLIGLLLLSIGIGTSLPTTCAANDTYYITTSPGRLYICTVGNNWTAVGGSAVWGGVVGTLSNQTDLQTALDGKANVGGGGLASGLIVMTLGASCPTGFTEVSALSGKFVLGTTQGAGNVGTTGGSDSITEVLNHTHPVTDPGHSHLTQRYPTATGSSTGFTIDTSMSGTLADNTLPVKSATTGVTTGNPAGGVASIDNRPSFTRVIFCAAN